MFGLKGMRGKGHTLTKGICRKNQKCLITFKLRHAFLITSMKLGRAVAQ